MDKSLKENDATAYLLDGMYKNVKIGCENIVSVLPKVNDRFLISELTRDLEGYSKYAKDIEDMMHERGIEPSPPGMLAKIGAKAGIAFNTTINSTSSHIARMYIGETNESARRLERMCHEVKGKCDTRVLGVCGKIIEKERLDAAKMEAFV